MKFFFSLMIIFFSYAVKAQFLERVFLKDSITVHEGWIIEQVPQEYLKILRFKQRDTITVDVADVMKITREIDPDKLDKLFKNPLRPKQGLAQAVYFELLGNGGIYSINYDRRFKKGRRDGLGFRAGFGYFRLRDSFANGYQKVTTIAIPVDVNYLIGKQRGALELGLSTTYVSSRENGTQYTYFDPPAFGAEAFEYRSNGFIGFANVAYRRRSAKNGFMFKAGFTPMIFPEFLPFIGISFGYHFQK